MCHTPQNSRSQHGKHSRLESHGAQDPHGFVIAQRDRRNALSDRRIPERHQRFFDSGRSGHGAALHGLPRPDHRRRAGHRISDRAHASHLRILPRQRQLRDRRESSRRARSRTTASARPATFRRARRDFDASIVGAHVVPTDSSLLSGLNATIVSVANGTAGSKPTVTFTLTNNAGNGVPISALGSLSLTMAGPTTDYGYTIFGSDTTSTPGYVTESATIGFLQRGRNLHLHLHARRARRSYRNLCDRPRSPPHGNGSGRPAEPAEHRIRRVQSGQLLLGGRIDCRAAAPGGRAETNCNQCHVELSLHGTLRNNTLYCVMCHNPSNTDATHPGGGYRRGGQGAAAPGHQFQHAGASHPLRPQRHGGWRKESLHRGRIRRQP